MYTSKLISLFLLVRRPGLEVRLYMPVWYTGTSLVGLKSYRHFLAECHADMP